jgi:hypothetical protein
MPHVYDDQIDGPLSRWPMHDRVDFVIRDEPATIPAPPARSDRRAERVVGIACMLVVIAMFVWAYKYPEPRRAVPRIGIDGVITQGGPRFPSLEWVPMRLDDKDRNTRNGIPRVPEPGVTVHLAPGSRVLLFAAGTEGTLVEPTSGPYRGRIGWVPRGYSWSEGLPSSITGLDDARHKTSLSSLTPSSVP